MEFTLFEIEVDSGILKAFQDHAICGYVLRHGSVVSSRVVQVVLHALPHHRLQDVRHPSLKIGGGIGKPERHDVHHVWSVRGHERGLPSILGFDTKLVVSHLEIELREELRTLHAFQGFVDAWQRVAILDRDIVEFSVVDDGLSSAVLFPHEEKGGSDWCTSWSP